MSADMQATADHLRVTDTTEAPHAARILDHEYDGIREYDNPLPGWWTAIFWGSVGFAVAYYAYFHIAGAGTSPDESYRAALVVHEARRALQDPTAGTSEERLARGAADPATLDRGRAVFAGRCASCHGPEGAGMIGPNLTDRFQLHGQTRLDLFKTIVVGVPGTAMLAWRDQLSSGELADAAAFVAALRGKDLAGKAPQGNPVAAFAP